MSNTLTDAKVVTPEPEPVISEPPHVFEVEHAVLTHTGLVRDHNEDDYLTIPEAGVYIVADGMGGHAAGRVASGLCVESVRDFFAGDRGEAFSPEPDYAELSRQAVELAESLRNANRRIFGAASRDRALSGMGTTAVGVRVYGDRIAIAHAGDSRCYLYRDGEFTQVTVDHSLSNFLLALGREIEAQMAEATMSNVIMRALGLEPDVIIDTQEFRLREGDRLVICSDGLSDLVDEEEIAAHVANPDLLRDDLVELLVEAALDAGGRDNITVMVIDVLRRLADEALEGRDLAAETVEMPSVDGDVPRPTGGSGTRGMLAAAVGSDRASIAAADTLEVGDTLDDDDDDDEVTAELDRED